MQPQTTPRPVKILLAEDNPGDVFLVREALREHKVAVNLHLVEDGETAIAYLEQVAREAAVDCPDLILLDLNLPTAEGTLVLERLRSLPQCGATPVIVVSSSENPRERKQVEELGAVAYFRKPCDLDGFLALGELVRHHIQLPA